MNNRTATVPIFLTLAWAWISPLSLAADPGASADSSTTDTTLSQPLPLPDATAGTSGAPTQKPPVPNGADRFSTYTVIHGGTVQDVARKCHCSARSIRKLNHLVSSRVKAGQVLIIPLSKAVDLKSKKKARLIAFHSPAPTEIPFHKRHREPLQDLDVPASTFASCPTPPGASEDDADIVPAPDFPATTAPRALPVPVETVAPVAPPVLTSTAPAASPAALPATRTNPAQGATLGTDEFSFQTPAPAAQTVAPPVLPPKPHRSFFSFFESTPPPADDWATRFTQAARELGDRGIEYDEGWRPPGESHAWAMDCSNTTRYLYKVTAGILLPRTASDQYYYLHLQNKAWDVPQTASGYADCNYLRENLKAGDLLFWENTYRPERQPPITHVMIFLGTNQRGDWIMAGSQGSRGGEHNRRHGGPDIYVFDPTKPCGGYTTWMGLVHHQGRFCAYGRPLEADRSKLAVATND